MAASGALDLQSAFEILILSLPALRQRPPRATGSYEKIADARQGDAQGPLPVSAPNTQVLDADAYGALGAVGRGGIGDADGERCDALVAATRRRCDPSERDKTRKEKCGRKHPLGYVSRENEHAPYTFGFDMVVMIASWDRFRFPVAIAPLDPDIKGHQNLLFRHMLKTFKPPSWVRQVVVSADAGFAANTTLQLIDDQQWAYVFAMPRTRKFTNGKYIRDLVRHLPKSCYHRRASYKPDGRRRDYWVFVRHATLNHLGDVTIVLSKKRRNDGPKQVKLFVTNLTEAHADAILSEYAWRWGWSSS